MFPSIIIVSDEIVKNDIQNVIKMYGLDKTINVAKKRISHVEPS